MKKRFSLFAVVLLLLCATGCDSDRLTQFATFAGLGTAYVSAFHHLTNAAATAYIDSDSFTLVRARDTAPAPRDKARFTRALQDDNTELKKYLANLKALDAQADALNSYFALITQLTDGKSATAISTSAENVATQLGTLNDSIANFSFAGKKVTDFAGSLATLAVTHFEAKTLDRRLQHDAPIIDRALTLQEAAIAALIEQVKGAVDTTLLIEEQDEVLGPYLADGPIGPSWYTARERFIRRSATFEQGAAAKDAVAKLHDAFRDLVSNKQATINVQSILDAIQNLLNFSAAASGNSQ